MNFILEWENIVFFYHKKKVISSSHRVIFCLLYRQECFFTNNSGKAENDVIGILTIYRKYATGVPDVVSMNLRVVYFTLKQSCLYNQYCFSSYVTGHIACLKLNLTISFLKSLTMACVVTVFAGISLSVERVFLFLPCKS